MTAPKDLRIVATDGFSLAATELAPSAAPRAVVLINSAMGVKRGFYVKLAAWLAEQGFVAICWDPRGIGDSLTGSAARFPATITDWGTKDLAGVIAWAEATYAGVPIIVIGHSVGGQIVGLAPNADRLRGFLGVSAQLGDWRFWSGRHRLGMFALWHVVIPGLAKPLGYLPKGLMGERLPAGVVLEWARWGRTRGYLGGGPGGDARRESFSKFRGDVALWSFDDDNYAPMASVDAVAPLFVNARRVDRRHLTTRELGRSIGHFNAFRDSFRETLWRDMAGFVESCVSA